MINMTFTSWNAGMFFLRRNVDTATLNSSQFKLNLGLAFMDKLHLKHCDFLYSYSAG